MLDCNSQWLQKICRSIVGHGCSKCVYYKLQNKYDYYLFFEPLNEINTIYKNMDPKQKLYLLNRIDIIYKTKIHSRIDSNKVTRKFGTST